MRKQQAVWKLISDSLSQGASVMLLYVLQSSGSSPGRQGFAMAVNQSGQMAGSIGGGIMEHKFIEMAKEILSSCDVEVIKGVIKNVPPGLGEPVFDKLSADLGKAMLSINAVKGFEIGSGFNGITMRGSEHNDPFVIENGNLKIKTNHAGGTLGGISTGEDIYFRVAFKPVSTISKNQQTVNLEHQSVELQATGRHDPCVLPRAIPIVDAMSALVIMDHFLRQNTHSGKE